jgi:hypothetical protein
VNFLTAMGLLIGQSKDFFELLRDLAEMQARPDESATDLFVRILWKAPSQRPRGVYFVL